MFWFCCSSHMTDCCVLKGRQDSDIPYNRLHSKLISYSLKSFEMLENNETKLLRDHYFYAFIKIKYNFKK